VEILLEAHSERSLRRARASLKKVDLLVLDELGFVPLPPSGAELLFDIVSDRYEKGSIALTTNLSFEEWISVLATEALTHALLDRLRTWRSFASVRTRGLLGSGPGRTLSRPETQRELCKSMKTAWKETERWAAISFIDAQYRIPG
jgi:hypothetical protein